MGGLNLLLRLLLLISWTSYPLLFLFCNNIGFIRDGGISLPLVLLNSLAIAGYLILSAWIKKPNNSAIISMLLLLFFQIYGHLYYGLMDSFSIPYENFKHRFYLPIYLLFVIVPIYLLWRKKEIKKEIITVLSLVGAMLCFQFTPTLLEYLKQQDTKGPMAERPPQKLDTPDIYYLILDSYSTKENLNAFYGFDNSPFEDELKQMGFEVIPKAKSNYPYTYFSLSSSLNMRYVNDYEDSVKLEKYDEEYPFTQIHHNKVADYLRAKGYRYVLSKSAYDQLNDPTAGDIFIDNAPSFNQFHQAAVSLSLLSAFNLEAFYHHKNYDITKQAYLNWSEILAIPGSKFVFFHSLPPHPPFVFNADGSYKAKEDRTENLYGQKEDYLDQIKYVNDAVSKAARQILETTNGNAIIIIQGDHGTCSSTKYSDEMKWPIDPPADLVSERYGILNAIYLPEQWKIPFGSNHTPVNTFRKIFNVLFNDSLEMQENQFYYGRYRPPYLWKAIEISP